MVYEPGVPSVVGGTTCGQADTLSVYRSIRVSSFRPYCETVQLEAFAVLAALSRQPSVAACTLSDTPPCRTEVLPCLLAELSRAARRPRWHQTGFFLTGVLPRISGPP